MPRLSVQELITPILICAFSFASNAAESIGLAMAKGSFQVDNSQVYGNTTLLEGATIQTEKSSSRLQLNNGTRMDLAENSRARIFDKHATLERGQGEVESHSNYQMEARTLRISPAGTKSIARVKLAGEKQVLVAAVNGPVRVFNQIGLLVANMPAGAALLFTPQAGQASTFQMSG